MPDSFDPKDNIAASAGDSHCDLEQLIFAARDYVIPTDDHRPRTLEAAREAWWERRHVRHVGLAALTCAATWFMSLALVDAGSVLRGRIFSRSATSVISLMEQREGQGALSSDWALVQAVDRWGALNGQRPVVTEQPIAADGDR